jgi:GTP-binding protein EngB required for normal cell division
MTALAARLAALERAAAGVRELGLSDEAAAAADTVRHARERAGFPGDAYVLALAGGTGVGKSSVLNALAGRTVSAVRAVRPTTDEPIAWVADDRREELAPLLEWLGVRHVAGHADASLSRVAVLDLPDVDSLRTEHRALVDELLPRIDAVAWVVDPEKYDDERLHAYLRALRHHAARLRFVLNKADRVRPDDLPVLERDLARRLEEAGVPAARIDVVSAADGTGVDRLRNALAAEADAKALVTAKLAADARSAAERLGAAIGVGAEQPAGPLVSEERVTTAIGAAVDGALAVVDPPGLARQVQAAVLGRARRSGGSLLGRVLGLLAWMTGQQRRRADPSGYLRDWRRRGSLGRVLNPVRSILVEAAARVPAPSRPAVLRALGADDLESAVTRALDGVARDASRHLHVPGSWLWPVVGVLQMVAGAAFLLAAAWYVTLFLAAGGVPVTTLDLPVLGPIPLPLALLAGSVVVSAVLGWLLALHAGWIGRRRGHRVAEEVRASVGAAIEDVGLRGLRRVEETRRAIAETIGAMT